MPLAAITTACHLIRLFCILTPVCPSLLHLLAKHFVVAGYRPKQAFCFCSAWKALRVQVYQRGLDVYALDGTNPLFGGFGCHGRGSPASRLCLRLCAFAVIGGGKSIEDCLLRLSRRGSTARRGRLRLLRQCSSVRGRHIDARRVGGLRRFVVAMRVCRWHSSWRCVMTGWLVVLDEC